MPDVNCSYLLFSMNTTVTAQGMQVKAASEGGIVIAPYTHELNGYVIPDSTTYQQDATATFSLPVSVAGLYPTSTKNLINWYHATSASVNSHEAKTGSYAALTMTATTIPSTSGVTEYEGIASDGNYYFLMNKFAVKSLDTATDTTNAYLYVKAVEVSVSGSANSSTLNKSLRVAIKTGLTTAFFAPLYENASTGTLYYYGIASSGDTASKAEHSSITRGETGLSVLVSSAINYTNATPIEIYLYYEGEDENCKSINAANIDTLTVKVTFSTSAS